MRRSGVRVTYAAPPFALRASGGKPPAARTRGEEVPSEALAQEGLRSTFHHSFCDALRASGGKPPAARTRGEEVPAEALAKEGCARHQAQALPRPISNTSSIRPAGFGWQTTRSAHSGRRGALRSLGAGGLTLDITPKLFLVRYQTQFLTALRASGGKPPARFPLTNQLLFRAAKAAICSGVAGAWNSRFHSA